MTATTGSAVVTPRERAAWVPTGPLISTRLLELRKRIGLMVTVGVLVVGIPVLVLGLRLAFHLFDPSSYGPAGTPSIFSATSNVLAEFGFIAAAVLGTAAGTSDLSDGMFRHLVITGRSRVALYLARLPAGLALVVPLVAAAFLALCLVCSFESAPAPSTVAINGVQLPAHLDAQALEGWIEAHPRLATIVLAPSGSMPPRELLATLAQHLGAYDALYHQAAVGQGEPAPNEMAKVGAWIELNAIMGLLIGIGLGSLLGQRTVATILMVALELIITPLLGSAAIPYFLNGQRLLVGIALDQLRPAGLAVMTSGPGHRVVFGGRGALNLPPMPTWAMVSVIVGWAVVWTGLGAWRMATRDA